MSENPSRMRRLSRKYLPATVAALCILASLAFGMSVARIGRGDLGCVETVQLTLFVATLPWAVAFIVLYARDRWWRSPFGWSLMMIAVAVTLYSASAVLFRLFGQEYPLRDAMILGSSALTFLAIVVRTLVLRGVQRGERHSDRRG
jgi:FlaA1/EpsC-like NDP-sugar epimerase